MKKFTEHEIAVIKEIANYLNGSENNNYELYVIGNSIQFFHKNNIKNTRIIPVSYLIATLWDNAVLHLTEEKLNVIIEKTETLLLNYQEADIQNFIKTCIEYINESFHVIYGNDMTNKHFYDAIYRALYFVFISEQDDNCYTLTEKGDWLYSVCEDENEYDNVLEFLLSVKNYIFVFQRENLKTDMIEFLNTL